LDDLDPAKSVLRVRFGDLGLINCEWPILGMILKWNRTDWPMPDFALRDPLGRIRTRLIRHSDDDPNLIVAEYPIDDDPGLGAESVYGYGAVEIMLTKLLG
jgi:hypothetical protein